MNVKIIDHSQNPIETIYRAFRICYSKDLPTEIKIPTMETAIGDVPDTQKMLEFIKKHMAHESPIEHISFTFAIEGVSRITEQQLTRHRIGASYSIQSGRYVNKSTSQIIIPKSIANDETNSALFKDCIGKCQIIYNTLLSMDVPKEDARYIMPQGQATNIIMTMNARELIHFLQERLCVRAQWEIRELAEEIRKQVNELLPIFNRKDIIKCGKTCWDCEEKKGVSNDIK